MSRARKDRSRRRWRAPAARLWAALGLVALASGPEAAPDGARERLVEVRASGHVLAPSALLLQSEEHGMMLRIGDLTRRLPRDLPRVVPVKVGDAYYMPLAPIAEFVRLDAAGGVLEFVGVPYAVPSLPFARAPDPGALPVPPGGSGGRFAAASRLAARDLGELPVVRRPRPLPPARAGGGVAPGPAAPPVVRDPQRSARVPLRIPQSDWRIEELPPLPPDAAPAAGFAPAPADDAGETVPAAGPPVAQTPGTGAAPASLPRPDGGPLAELLWLGEGEPPGILPAAGPALSPAIVEEGVPGAVRRREPLQAPLLPDEEWQEWLVSVTLNGEEVSQGALVLRGPGNAFAARVVDLRQWRVRLDEDRIVSFNGEPFYPLAALPELQQSFDPQALALTLSLPPQQFEATAIERGRPSVIEARAGRGGFFDYDILFLAGEGVRERLDALLELGLFDAIGVFITNVRVGDITGADGEREVVRLETTFVRDLPQRRASLIIGDSITAGGALGLPVRFGGVQYSTNFATDPTFITFPLPSIGGLTEQPALAEVFLENTRRVVQEVPPGPFEIDDLPVLTGAGEVQLRVTDLLGREQIVTQDYYVSTRLLRAGLTEFSYELGFERDDFNEESFVYENPFAAATQRYGFSNAATGEGRVELAKEAQTLGVGGSFLLGNFGLLSGGLSGSLAGGARLGYDAFIDYEYLASRFSVGLRTRYTHEDFRQLGAFDGDPDARTDQVSLGLGLYPYGRIGLLFVNTEARESDDLQALSLNYSVPIGPGTLLLSGLQTLQPESELALTAAYSLPLGLVHSVGASVDWREDATRGRVEYRRGRGSSDLGPSFRVATEAGEDSRLFDGSFRYDAPVASGQLDVVHDRGETRARANLSGSVAHVDGQTGFTRRLGRAFGMVALPGHPDVTVYLENREVGRTDEEGYLFLPRLNPYQQNRVRIRPEDLPLTAEIAAEEQVAVPYARTGIRIPFDVAVNRTALVTLRDAAGEPLPAGLELAGADGRVEAQVADEGLAYVRSTVEEPVTLRSVPGQPPYACPLPALPEEPLSQLGEVTCEEG